MPFNPEQVYIITESPIKIRDFHAYKEEYITRPPYQRKTVWSNRKKYNLLDSLFRRYYIPKIVIREVRLDNEKVVYEIIDGQQRINVVQEFFDNKLKIPKSLRDLHSELPGKYYKDLSVEFRRFIDRELQYSADIVKGIQNPKDANHQKIATEIFWRLQQGEYLNYMEIAHARLSSLARNFIVKYSDDITFDFDNYRSIDNNPNKHKFFSIIDRNNNRMQHLMLLTRILLIEEFDGCAELKDTQVIEFIDKHEVDDGIDNYSFENHQIAENAISTLDLFYDIFKDDPIIDKNSGLKELNREYIIISFYLLLRHLKKYYVFQDDEKEYFRKFLFDFHSRWRSQKDDDFDILSFTSHRQQSKKDVEVRDRILRQLFFEFVKKMNREMILKDERRTFDEADRISIYRKQNGLCQKCLEEGKNEIESRVSWNDFEADHIIPHTRGGRTEIWNGQVLCRYHNRAKGAS